MENSKKKLGRYELLAELATGGMAEIHLARQTGIAGFERLVVIKKLLPHLKKEKKFLEMFLDEARIVAQMSHPNIVQIYELGEEQSEYYIAMEYLEGESLGYLVRKALASMLRLPPSLAVNIAVQVCHGLEYAHTLLDNDGNALKVVHRDVSPQNIIVLFSGGVKLLDFGVAKAASKLHKTKVGTLKGKFAYMSPEQCLGQPVDNRSDLFSLGIVLWEVLSYRRLFKREQEAATINAIINTQVRPPSQTNKKIPPYLDAVVLKALEKDPNKRFQSAEDMGSALNDALRKMGKPAGVREMSQFMKKVFADRARTKNRLLQDLRSGDVNKISISVLKPDTEESLPSRSAKPSGSFEKSSPQPSIESTLEDGSNPAIVPPPIPKVPKHKKPHPKQKPKDTKRAQLGNEPVGNTKQNDSPIAGRESLALLQGKIIYLWVGVLLMVSIGLLLLWPEDKNDGQSTTTQAVDSGQVPDAGLQLAVTGFVDGGSQDAYHELKLQSSIDGGQPTDQSNFTEVRKPSNSIESATTKENPKEKQGPIKNSVAKSHHPVKKRQWGTLRLDTDPWSEVYLGKRKLGITPLLGVKLPTGRYRLELVNSSMKKHKAIWVRIRAGKATKLFKKL